MAARIRGRALAEGELVKLRIGETSWTDEQTQTLTRLWNSGLSATLIAPQIGVTRSAALGKLKRLGLLGNRRLLRPRKPRERSVWTDETARKLRRLWEEGESTSDIAFALGVSPGAIRYKSSSLGLARAVVWTDEKTALLRRRYRKGESFAEIALACGVSKSSVENKAHALGLRRLAPRTRWTDEKVIELRRLRKEGKTRREIALALALPGNAVLSKTRSLKLPLGERPKKPKPPPQRTRWTPERTEELRRLWGEGLTAKEVALALGVSTYAIQQRICVFKIRRERPPLRSA